MLEKAIDIAMRAHQGQTRMDGKTPYIMHPMAVMNILTEMGFMNDKLLAAAVLHDVIEDCDKSFEKEIFELDRDVHGWAYCLTCHDDYDKYNARFHEFPLEVHWIKCADIIHNVTNHPRAQKYARKKMRQLLSMNPIVHRHDIFQRAYEVCKEKIESGIYG